MSVREFEGSSVLFLTPTFLARRLHKQIRGVQVFDLLLLRRLHDLGVRVTVAAESTWRPRLETHLAGAMPEVVYTPSLLKPFWNGLALRPLLLGRRFDALLVGNVGNGLGPTVRALAARCDRTTLIAHREPRPAFLRALRGVPIDIVAVNDAIGARFGPSAERRVTVRYGIPNADLFYPRDFSADAPDRPVRFCMIGRMDTPLKRMDMVVDAFERLSSEVRSRCELHLMGFPEPPAGLASGVVAHPWMTVAEIAVQLREMDVVVVASESETFCQALVQGMLCGLAGVVRDLPTLIEKMEGGAGVVFSTGDQLVAALDRMATRAGERAAMGAQGRALALERYVWDTEWFAREHLFPRSSG